MSAERTYVDTSALCQLYVHGARSMSMASWRFKQTRPIPVTKFGRLEILSAIALAAFRDELDNVDRKQAERILAEDFTEGRLRLVDLPWRAVFDQAAALVEEHSPALGTRSLDVLQVASAMELNARHFLTYDTRQARLAAACGLKILQP